MRRAVVTFQSLDGRTMVLRPLTMRDLRAATRFANTLSREKESNPELGIISLDRRVTERDEREFLNRIVAGRRTGDEISLAAFDGRRMVGHCHVSRRKQRDVRHTGVYGISILDGYRGVGIGTRLTEEVLRETQKMGVWLVELEVMGMNKGGLRLYEKLGFQKAGVIPDKVLRRGRHIDIVVMYVDLRNR